MKKVAILLGVALAIGLVAQVSGASSTQSEMLEFDKLAGVNGPFVGTANPIRGVSGGGLPWQIAAAEGHVLPSGRLHVEVQGLVLLDAAPVPPELQGTNPVPFFKVVVSCLTTMNGAAVRRNVSTHQFPATTAGDAMVTARVMLPRPCFAPILFVTSPTDAWFAVTGR